MYSVCFISHTPVALLMVTILFYFQSLLLLQMKHIVEHYVPTPSLPSTVVSITC